MASIDHLKRTVLLSIIRAPTLSQQRSLAIPLAHNCAFHAIPARRKEGLSITFGSKIDELLDSNRQGPKGSSDKREYKKKSSTKGSPLKTGGPSNTLHPTSQQEPTPNDSKIASHDSAVTEITEIRSKSVVRPQTTHVTDRDNLTLGVSEDAYDMISRPGTIPKQARSGGQGFLREDPEGLIAQDVSHATTKSKLQAQTNHPTQGAKPSVTIQKSDSVAPKLQKKLESWQIQKKALQDKFGEQGWNPRKKLSPDALEGIRSLHAEDPIRYSTATLSLHFKVSPEAIRRILKSKWRPSADVMQDRRERWARRHDRIWDQKAALGLLPPRETDREPEDPEAFEEEVKAKKLLGKL